MTVFQQTVLSLGAEMRADSVGKGHSLQLRTLPPNNTSPGGALIGIFDGEGGGAVLCLTAQGVANLRAGCDLIINGGRS